MRKIITALAISALALTGGAVSAKQTASEKGEAQLQKLIAGRTAGEPKSCINTMRQNGMRIIDRTAIVYESGDTVWVARPTDSRQLRRTDILVIDRVNGSQLCTNDTMYTIDQSSGMYSGAVFLKEFVPYTKPKG
ncbi:hypothetical protein H0274_08080 [Altererythrobacter sp. CC-YST694]|uniref:hypothetical protein n=1 Tax=Altererythrobacter sp. CC-YST694 TaxID=2755038 RepID=UPI001D00A456|nr:hypothetical protein [Altererythrobacter sp. CC-YST694]MCB5425211.1 hypothetical protein [Altererythrobacter sp. CC-YST694]